MNIMCSTSRCRTIISLGPEFTAIALYVAAERAFGRSVPVMLVVLCLFFYMRYNLSHIFTTKINRVIFRNISRCVSLGPAGITIFTVALFYLFFVMFIRKNSDFFYIMPIYLLLQIVASILVLLFVKRWVKNYYLLRYRHRSRATIILRIIIHTLSCFAFIILIVCEFIFVEINAKNYVHLDVNILLFQTAIFIAVLVSCGANILFAYTAYARRFGRRENV